MTSYQMQLRADFFEQIQQGRAIPADLLYFRGLKPGS